MTSIVNVIQKYIKDEYENLKEWCKYKNNIYIDRKGVLFIDGERFSKENSLFHNPYKIKYNINREEIILQYKIYLLKKIRDDKNFRKEFYKLKNKNLGCWCKPEKCHKNIIIEILNRDKKKLFNEINILIKIYQTNLNIYNNLKNYNNDPYNETLVRTNSIYDMINEEMSNIKK